LALDDYAGETLVFRRRRARLSVDHRVPAEHQPGAVMLELRVPLPMGRCRILTAISGLPEVNWAGLRAASTPH
jgi:hypothetical protein